MRIMFDGITPGEVPAGAQLYAGYLNGTWPSYNALAAAHPGAVHVSISVTASYNGAQVLDVEKGDATPAEAVGWVLKRRAAGADPTVYCGLSAWPTVRDAFRSRGVAEPHYWVASYSASRTIPAGAIALQYADRGGYDESVVADYWPGVDPAPKPPATPSPLEDDMAYLISVTPDPTLPGEARPTAGIFTVDGGTVTHVDGPSYGPLVARLGQPVVVSPTYYAALLAHQAPKAGA